MTTLPALRDLCQSVWRDDMHRDAGGLIVDRFHAERRYLENTVAFFQRAVGLRWHRAQRFDGSGNYDRVAHAILGGVYGLCRVLTRWASRRGLIDNACARAIWILGAIFGAALLTHALELSAVVGGFFAGLGTGEGLARTVRELSLRILNPLVLVLMPFFFVMVGVQAQWDILNESALVWFVTGLIALAIITKAAGGMMGTTRAHSGTERWLIAFGMVPRGEIALVIVTLGFDQGHVTHHVFVAVVLMAIVLSIVGPLFMAPFAKRLASERLVGSAP